MLHSCSRNLVPQACAKASSFLPETAPEDLRKRMREPFSRGARGVIYWLARFKQRWNVEKGLLKSGEQFEPLGSKFCQIFFCGNFRKIAIFGDQFWVQNLVPKTGPHFWVLIGILLKPDSRSQKWVRFRDPFLGPFLDHFLAFFMFFLDLFRVRFWGPLNLPGHRQKEFAMHVALG